MCTDGAEEGWAGVKKTTAGRPWPGRVGEGQRDTPLYDGTQKVEHLPHGEKSEHEYPSSYTHWSAIGRGKFRENYRCFWRLMRKEGILSSNLPPFWVHSLTPVVFSKGPSVQSWPVLSHRGMICESREEPSLWRSPWTCAGPSSHPTPGGTESTWQHRRCGFNLLGWEDPLEEEMATHSSILLSSILSHGQRSLAGLQSTGSQRVGLDLATKYTCKC